MPEFEPPVPQTAHADGPLPRRRPTAARIALVAALAVAAAATVWLERSGGGPADRPAPRSSAEPDVLDLRAPGGAVLDLPGRVTAVDLNGPGVAIAQECSGEVCERTIAVTEYGVSWTRRALPPALAHGPRTDPLHPLALGHGSNVVLETAGRRWYSGDGGASWRPVPGGSAAAVPVLRAGRPVLDPHAAAKDSSTCPAGRVGVLLSGSGQFAPLAQQPPLTPCWIGPVPDQDLHYWVGGLDPITQRPAVAVWSDGDRRWRTAALPDAAPDAASVEMTWLGESWYATVLGYRGMPRGLRSLYRSDDRGRHWQRVSQWPEVDGPAIRGELVPRQDASLLAVGSDGTVWLSNDGGTSFRRRLYQPRLGAVQRTAGGWVTQVQAVSASWLASVDGITWHELGVR